MRVIVTAIIMILILFVPLPSLYYNQKWRELLVFLIFWGTSSAYAILVVAKAPIPTSTEVITAVLEILKNVILF